MLNLIVEGGDGVGIEGVLLVYHEVPGNTESPDIRLLTFVGLPRADLGREKVI